MTGFVYHHCLLKTCIIKERPMDCDTQENISWINDFISQKGNYFLLYMFLYYYKITLYSHLKNPQSSETQNNLCCCCC